MNTYPWRCPCGQYLSGPDIEKIHIEWCSYDPIGAIAESVRRLEVQREPIVHAIEGLVNWRPETAPQMPNPVCGTCGWEELPYHKEGGGAAGCDYKAETFEDTPFMSEEYLYPLLGKEDARSLLGFMRRIATLAGYKGDI